jgi:hypothetical protein
MPIRSGAIQRPSGCRYGNMLRQRYDEVGLPCSNTMGSPSPTSTYAISLPRTCRRFFWYGNAAEIMLAFPTHTLSHDNACFGSIYGELLNVSNVRNQSKSSSRTSTIYWVLTLIYMSALLLQLRRDRCMQNLQDLPERAPPNRHRSERVMEVFGRCQRNPAARWHCRLQRLAAEAANSGFTSTRYREMAMGR